MQNSVAKINIPAIIHNAEFFKKYTGAPLCAVVKGNAYGHGGEKVVSALEGKASLFAVATIEEGIKIQTASCQTPILVFTPPMNREEGVAICEHGFVATVDAIEQLSFLKGNSARIHIKVNTGMNRYGAEIEEVELLCRKCKEIAVEVEGIYSHFYSERERDAKRQAELFDRAVSVCKRYFPSAIAHLSSTYGCTYQKRYAYDMVRVGIGLYGYAPYKRGKTLPLQKAMRVYAPVVKTRVFQGGGIGYGKNRIFGKGKSFSLIRTGYADGLFRKRKNPLIAKRCMDVSFYAEEKANMLCVMEDALVWAKKYHTIPHEILCMITRRAEFFYE